MRLSLLLQSRSVFSSRGFVCPRIDDIRILHPKVLSTEMFFPPPLHKQSFESMSIRRMDT